MGSSPRPENAVTLSVQSTYAPASEVSISDHNTTASLCERADVQPVDYACTAAVMPSEESDEDMPALEDVPAVAAASDASTVAAQTVWNTWVAMHNRGDRSFVANEAAFETYISHWRSRRLQANARLHIHAAVEVQGRGGSLVHYYECSDEH